MEATKTEVTIGITWDGKVRQVTIAEPGNVHATLTMSSDTARFTARELIAAADRADAILLAIRIRDAGTKAEAKL